MTRAEAVDAELAEAKAELRAVNAACQRHVQAGGQATEAMATLRAQLAASDASLRASQAEKVSLSQHVAQLEERIAAEEDVRGAAAQSSKLASRELVELRHDLSEARLDLSSKESALGVAQERVYDLEEEVATLRAEAGVLRAEAGDTRHTAGGDDTGAGQSTQDMMEGLMRHKDAQLAKLSARLSSLIASAEEHADENRRLREQLSRTHQSATDMRERLIDRAERAETALRLLRASVRSEHSSAVATPADPDDLAAQLSRAHADKGEAESRACRAEAAAAQASRAVKQARKDMRSLEARVGERSSQSQRGHYPASASLAAAEGGDAVAAGSRGHGRGPRVGAASTVGGHGASSRPVPPARRSESRHDDDAPAALEHTARRSDTIMQTPASALSLGPRRSDPALRTAGAVLTAGFAQGPALAAAQPTAGGRPTGRPTGRGDSLVSLRWTGSKRA